MKRFFVVRVKGLEPSHLAAPDPKSGVSTNFTIPAFWLEPVLTTVVPLRRCKYTTHFLICKKNFIFFLFLCL